MRGGKNSLRALSAPPEAEVTFRGSTEAVPFALAPQRAVVARQSDDEPNQMVDSLGYCFIAVGVDADHVPAPRLKLPIPLAVTAADLAGRVHPAVTLHVKAVQRMGEVQSVWPELELDDPWRRVESSMGQGDSQARLARYGNIPAEVTGRIDRELVKHGYQPPHGLGSGSCRVGSPTFPLQLEHAATRWAGSSPIFLPLV